MLFPFPLELFPFLLIAQNYSHSMGFHPMEMGIPITMHTPTRARAKCRQRQQMF